MTALDPGSIDALTFDCYGTLIDWYGGIRGAVAEMPSLAGLDQRALERLLADRERSEAELEAESYLPYDEVLRQSMLAAAREQRREPSDAELDGFAASIARWPAHPDSPGALARLAGRYRLAILSNILTATLEQSVKLLGVEFEALVTAEELRSYKPATPHFTEGLRRLDLSSDRVLHVAASLYHDVRPARELGWRVVWVDRLGEGLPSDLTGDAGPTAVVPDVAALADLLSV